MLVRMGAARPRDADRRLAWSLAAIAGALNAAGFYAVGLYSSNMTGNVSSIADKTALGDVGTALGYLALVLTFITGAAVSTLMINAGHRRGLPRIYAYSILAEAVLLTVLGLADLMLAAPIRGVLLVYGLSFLMGLQNATVTRISDARVRTTHVTGMVTDIGIELGNLCDAALRHPGGNFDREKLRLYGITVLSFAAGGVVGVAAYRRGGPYFLFAAALLLLLIALAGLVSRHAAPARPTAP